MTVINKNSSTEHISHHQMMRMLHKGRIPEMEEAFCHLAECELCNEAYAGLAELNDVNAVRNLKKQWQLHHKFGAKKININLQGFYILFSIVFVLCIAIFVVMYMIKTKPRTSNEIEKHNITNNFNEAGHYEPEQFYVSDSVISVSQNADEQISRPSAGTQKKSDEIEKVSPRSPVFNVGKPVTGELSGAAIHYPTLEIEGFLLYNYEEQYTRQSGSNLFMRNVSARFESAQTFADDSIHVANIAFIASYQKVMRLGLRSLKQRKYNKAIDEFDFILEHFPGDVNAIFYKALALERALRFEEATDLYPELNQAGNLFFDEPARYHRAFCLYKLNKINEALELLHYIDMHNGFYKKQAVELILEIESHN